MGEMGWVSETKERKKERKKEGEEGEEEHSLTQTSHAVNSNASLRSVAHLNESLHGAFGWVVAIWVRHVVVGNSCKQPQQQQASNKEMFFQHAGSK